jgi:diguanylate cyclase (GGDEF)-like protein/PAS domain S-box-containing protein
LRTTGYPASEILGRNCRFLQGVDTDPDAILRIQDALNAGREHVNVVRNYRKDGSTWWNELRLSPVRNPAGRLTHYIGFQNDVTERVEAEQRLAHLAFHDKLTGLPNRALLLHELDQAIALATRSGQQLTVLFIDLDGFKAINDRFGHAAGDLALAGTAMKLRRALRDGDLLGRYGGDEFIAVLTNVPDDQVRAAARRAADAVLNSFHSPLDLPEQPLQISVTIGVALFPEHARDSEALVRAADEAMYTAKRSGRGRAVIAPRPIPAAESTRISPVMARRSGPHSRAFRQ